MPRFLKDEFDAFQECGTLAHGFLRLRYEVIGWGNAAAEGGRVYATLGYMKGRGPRDAVFKRELEVELERLDVILRPRQL